MPILYILPLTKTLMLQYLRPFKSGDLLNQAYNKNTYNIFYTIRIGLRTDEHFWMLEGTFNFLVMEGSPWFSSYQKVGKPCWRYCQIDDANHTSVLLYIIYICVSI